MLLFNFCLKIYLTLYLINCTSARLQESAPNERLWHRIYGFLDELSCSKEMNGSAKFSLLLAEFLIKQKLRYMEPTPFEFQLYSNLLRRMTNIRIRVPNNESHGIETQILDNAFQKNILLLEPILKYGSLDANADYEKLAMNYLNVVNEGMPNGTMSDQCMRDLVTLSNCRLCRSCLNLLSSLKPTYGYQRTHQVLLLYMLQHHSCAPRLYPNVVYDLLAKSYCTEVQREQNAIRSLGLPRQYRDLYLEQATICGLNGYNEFVNWRNVIEVNSWFAESEAQGIENSKHIKDLALVFFINALLLLH